MNLSVKRCLVGLVASAAMFGIARAQDDESAGTVQLGQQVQSPEPAPAAAQVQVPAPTGASASMGQPIFSPPSMPGTAGLGQQPSPGSPGYGDFYQLSRIDQVFNPRFFIDSRGGGLYGYQAGYSTIGAFVPYKLEDNALLFASAMGMVTYDGRGGSSLGAGWRYYMEGLDRVVGLSAWFDLDNGHAQPYQQLGLSLESLGRYVDYRVNGYLPISHPDHILLTDLTQTAALIGNGIGLLRNNIVEQAYGGFDAEIGGPTPILGRYGLNAYIGGYQLMGMGVQGGQTTGVSGRLLSQINEDVSFGVQVTNDHLFGLNTQFQVFVNLPNGKSGRWLRNLRVRDRLNQNVFRQYRVLAKTQEFQSFDNAVNPATHQPYFVENINPNLATNGNGSAGSPFNSVAAYEALPLATRERVDMILVQPRSDATTTNLDTGANGTLELFNGQRLLSTAIAHTFTTQNFPGVVMTIPASAGATDPMLFNSTGGNVITLAPGNTRGIEVSGFEIIGSATGSGIVGNNNLGVNINNNNIHSGLTGVTLNNLSGTFAAGTQGMFVDNNIHDNLGSGVQVTNNGAPPFVPPLDVLVVGNTVSKNVGDGMKFVAEAGATIGGVIGGANVAATSTTPAITNANVFNANGGNGLDLVANGGILNFNAAAIAAKAATATTAATLAVPTFGIFNNTFTANTLNGLNIATTNSSISSFLVQNNSFGLASSSATGNQQFGISLVSDSGITTLLIGGDKTTNADGTTNDPGNVFNFNAVSAINLAVSGTALLNYNIDNNIIMNTASSTIPAPHDGFTFTFNGTSGVAPFDITNTSDPGVFITSVTWNLASTPANFVSQAATPAVGTTPAFPGLVIVQPVNNSDVTTGLTGVGAATIVPATNPLLVTGNAIADAAATGIPFTLAGPKGNIEISTVLPLTFGKNLFAPSSTFSGVSTLEQGNTGPALTSAATANSTVTVNFSNNLSTTATVHLDPTTSTVAVDATGSVTGSITPGFGQGSDGIHVIASGASTLNTAVIENNTVTGYGGYGIHVETSGTANASNVLVQNNTLQLNGIGVNANVLPVFTGGGLEISRHDSSTLVANLLNNTITNNFNNGLSLTADGTAIGGLTVNISGNTITGNAGNGLSISTAGAAVLSFSTSGSNFSGNGIGLGSNPNLSGTEGDNIAMSSSGTSVLNVTLTDVQSNNAAGSGLSATTNDSSTLNLLIQSSATGILNGTGSSFGLNAANGVVLTSNNDSYMHASFYNTTLNTNKQSGLAFNRNGASFVRSNIIDSTLSNNGVNGFLFHGLGSDPQDPNQQNSGSPNVIIMIGDALNANGNFAAGTGQGARFDMFGDSEVVLDASATTFNNNADNGIRIELTPGAEFGYQVGNQRSVLDNVDINHNGQNGIFITSDVTLPPPGNPFLPFNAPSVTFLQISSNTGDTMISNNGANGISLQYPGGTHDILITGDNNPTTNFGTFIQSNTLNGIASVAGVECNPSIAPGSGVVVTVDNVMVGGPAPADGNGLNGIDFEAQSQFTVNDTVNGPFTWSFNGAGFATLNVNGSLIQNNGADGIALIGNNLDAASSPAARFENGSGDASGRLAANISNSQILNNKANGVEITLTGQLGFTFDSTQPRGVDENNFVFTNNIISSNGLYGVILNQNTAVNIRSPGSVNPDFEVFDYNDPQPTNPASFLNSNIFGNQTLGLNFNNYNFQTNTNLIDGFEQSQWMWLGTALNSNLVMTGNQIQFNGTQTQIPGNGNPILPGGDGVFIRVSTNSYLSADIRNNTISGNVQNDFHVESFDAYNPVTNVAPQPTGSVARAAPALDTVVLDDTAQMDLRFSGNVGNTVNIVNPLVNFAVNGTLDPRTSPNGAVYSADPLKDAFSFTNPSPRVVQLFQVDNGNNLNTLNDFSQNGVTQDLVNGPTGFFAGDWSLRTVADPLFPNPAFPQNFATDPGQPFLP